MTAHEISNILAADGNIQIKEGRYTVNIGLRAQEKYLIEEFAKAVETDKTVKEYINSSGFQRKDGQPHSICRIVLHSKNYGGRLNISRNCSTKKPNL